MRLAQLAVAWSRHGSPAPRCLTRSGLDKTHTLLALQAKNSFGGGRGGETLIKDLQMEGNSLSCGTRQASALGWRGFGDDGFANTKVGTERKNPVVYMYIAVPRGWPFDI